MSVGSLLPIDAPLRDPASGLALRVEVQHPADGSVAEEEVADTPWLLDPAGGWLGAVAIDVTGPDGKACKWPLRASAARGDQPLRLETGARAWVVFQWQGQGPEVIPGRYVLRARLECDTGTGWRGRVVSAPLEVVVGGEPADVQCTIVGEPRVVRGVPFVVDVRVGAIGSRLVRPRDLDELAGALALVVTGAEGKAQAWPFRPPVMPWSEQTWLGLADAPLVATFGLPAAATAALPVGAVTLVATFAARAEGPSGAGAPRPARSAPLALTVVDAPANANPVERAEASRRVIAEALAEALGHRVRGPRSAGGYEGMVRAVSLAAAPLLRAEREALAWLRADPGSPAAAADVARVLLAGGDRELALVFANHAAALAAAVPVDAGTADTDESGPPPPHAVDPQEPWRLFAAAVAATPVDGERFLPELQRALAAARVATLPPTAWWATGARASSEYRSTDYSAQRATGAPDVPRAGDHKNGWASKTPDGGEEWLELDFPVATHAIAVRVVQHLNPGAVVRIEAVAADGGRTTLWQGPDRTAYAPNQIGTLLASFPRTATPVQRVRLVLDTRIGAGWNEIDAVQLVAAPH